MIEDIRNIHIYDIEVFRFDWLVVMYNIDRDKLLSFTNEQQKELRSYIAENRPILCGFNSKHYDDYILLGMLAGNGVDMIKAHNDHIIGGGQGWDFDGIKGFYKSDYFQSFDLRDDLPQDLSLKAIEGNVEANIHESEIDFNIDRPLTADEKVENEKYCRSDVMNTYGLFKLRKSYLDGKLKVAKAGGMDPVTALGLTNPKLSATFLRGKKLTDPRAGEFVYTPPEELRLEKYVEALDFYRVIDYEKSLSIKAKDLTLEYGWGGIHGAIKHYQAESSDTFKIVDIDVGSYYPSMMIQYGYSPDAIPSAQGYKDIYEQRLNAKHSEDSDTADALKLVLNSTYGALKNQYNILFQPSKANHICITGQLLLTDLIEKLEQIPTLVLIQANTDGLMIGYDPRQETRVNDVVLEWERRTRLKMEYTEIKKIVQKDVNNYVMIAGATYLIDENKTRTETKADKSKIAVKGGYVSLYFGGSFKNNSLVICHKALVNYLLNGTPIEKTINETESPIDFQIIAKTGSTYKGTLYELNGEKIPVQKVNRVYASKNENRGSLYKLKDGGRLDKIANLPEHCLIDNENTLEGTDAIDKGFYINLAQSWANDYLGKKKGTKKTMTTKKKETPVEVQEEKIMNIYEKLLWAKIDFAGAGAKKSGVNSFAEFKYFELKDIIPVANEVFSKHGLVFITSFDNDFATGTLINVEAPEERIVYTSPMRDLGIISATGKNKMNALQGLGAEETYQRRYLYMMCLEVVEDDTFDKVQQRPEREHTAPSTPPPTNVERKEIAANIAKGSDEAPANDLQKSSIKKALGKLRESDLNNDNAQEPFISATVARIKEGITESEAIEILNDINSILFPEDKA